MIRSVKVLLISLTIFCGNAQAEKRGLFLGANVSDVDTQLEESVSGLSLQLGYQYNGYVGVDARIGVFSNEARSMVRDPLYKQYALLGRVGYEWEQASVYLLLGYANTLSAVEDSDGGFAKGLEINLFGSPATAISLGYLSQDMNGENLGVISIGFVSFLDVHADSFKLRNPTRK